MKNMYETFFEVLKSYLVELEIEKKHKGIVGCSKEEIKSLEEKVGRLPSAYQAYLRSIGKKFLFQFMDAEDMAFDDLDYIEEFGKEVFEENKLTIERPYLVISERRSEYITLIYLDEGDNPRTLIMSDYWDEEKDGENLVVRTKSFTDLMLIFFSSTLKYHTAGFHFVTEEESKDEEIIQKRYLKWFKSLKKIADSIGENKVTNTMVRKLNERFMSYYLANEEFINEKLNEYNSANKYGTKTKNNTTKEKQVKTEPFVNRKTTKELLKDVEPDTVDKLIAIGCIIILIFLGIGIAMLLP